MKYTIKPGKIATPKDKITPEEKILSCQARPCLDQSHIWMDGKCRLDSDNLCPRFGEALVSSTDGSAICICDSGFARGLDGHCHQLFTKGYRGYCKENTIVTEINKNALCVENPCAKGKLPHFHTWKKFFDTIEDLECHYIAEDLKECEVEINDDDELVCGSISIINIYKMI
jgi:hypothetical protein